MAFLRIRSKAKYSKRLRASPFKSQRDNVPSGGHEQAPEEKLGVPQQTLDVSQQPGGVHGVRVPDRDGAEQQTHGRRHVEQTLSRNANFDVKRLAHLTCLWYHWVDSHAEPLRKSLGLVGRRDLSWRHNGECTLLRP